HQEAVVEGAHGVERDPVQPGDSGNAGKQACVARLVDPGDAQWRVKPEDEDIVGRELASRSAQPGRDREVGLCPAVIGIAAGPPRKRSDRSEWVDEVELPGAGDHEPTVLARPADVEYSWDFGDRGPGVAGGRRRSGDDQASEAEQHGRDQAHRGAHPISTSRLKNSYDEIRG